MFLSCISLFLLCVHSDVVASVGQEQKIKWQDMRTVTFYGGRMTTGRRPLPQIVNEVVKTYKYMSVKEKVVIDDEIITCTSLGPSEDARGWFPPLDWDCTSDQMWYGRAYDRLIVSCECYNHCDDDYVWIGSCQLEYTTHFINFWYGFLYCVVGLGLLFSPIIAIVVGVTAYHVSWKCLSFCSSQNKSRRERNKQNSIDKAFRPLNT